MKYFRIKAKKDFEKILKNGKRAHADSVTVIYVKDKRLNMAVCVGKKYGKSVKRNAIKRLLREAFRGYSECLQPCSVLLIPRVKEEYSYLAFARDLKKIFTKERLLES